MAKLQKTLRGNWIKPAMVNTGDRAVIASEVEGRESRFRDNEGNLQTQFVGMVRIADGKEYLWRFNRTTLDGLIDAFGNETSVWIGKEVQIIKDKVMVGGRKKDALFLAADGYVLIEDSEGYMHMTEQVEQTV